MDATTVIVDGVQGPCDQLSWSRLYAHRRAVAKRFGPLFSLPIAKRATDVVLRHLRRGSDVLDVGAADRRFERKLHKRGIACQYFSLDVDPANQHDFARLDDVTRRFDLIIALEVVEHIPIAQLPAWLASLATRLEPGGRLVVSTPNTFYPPAFLRDATHCTPLCYDELGGLVESAGLVAERIFRIHHDSVLRGVLRRYGFGWLFRLIGIDFARQIVVVARRPEASVANLDPP